MTFTVNRNLSDRILSMRNIRLVYNVLRHDSVFGDAFHGPIVARLSTHIYVCISGIGGRSELLLRDSIFHEWTNVRVPSQYVSALFLAVDLVFRSLRSSIVLANCDDGYQKCICFVFEIGCYVVK